MRHEMMLVKTTLENWPADSEPRSSLPARSFFRGDERPPAELRQADGLRLHGFVSQKQINKTKGQTNI